MRASFLFNEVWTGLRRNVTMTLAMILTTAISLTMLGGGFLAVRMAEKTQDYFVGRLEVRMMLTDDVSTTDPDCGKEVCQTLQRDLQSTPGVTSVQFMSQAEALEDAKKSFRGQPEMVDLITAQTLPASLRVKMSDATDYKRIVGEFGSRPGVLNMHNDGDVVDRLMKLFDGMRNVAFGLAMVQAIAALLLIANMVQIAAYTRRTEVGIMRLVGATRWFTQLPFLIEAVVAALAGTILAAFGLLAAKPIIIDRALGDQFNGKVFPMITDSDITLIAVILTPIGVLFAAATAYVTLRLYVRDEQA